MRNCKSHEASRARTRGFTLIELMITIAIVGILAALANAGYQSSVVKSRRATAKGCVLEGAQYMERYYTTKMTYNDGADAPVLPACSNDLTGYYTVSFSGAPTLTAYTVQAVPLGSQLAADTKCGTLTLDQVGAKTESGTGTVAECW